MGNPYKLKSYGYVELNDDIWFPNLNFNALMKINKSSGRIQIMDRFPGYDIWQMLLYTTVYQVGEWLVFIPGMSKEIISYHISTGEFLSVPMDLEMVGKKGIYFINAYVYKQYIYMLPVEAKCIVRYDTSNNSVKYLKDSLSVELSDLPESFCCKMSQFEIADNKLYIPFAELNAVAVFDPEDESLEIKYLDIEGGCSTINYIGEHFYLASWRTLKIYRWNDRTGEIKVYDAFPNGFEGGDYVFSCTCIEEGKLIFLPLYGNMILSFDLKSEELHEEKRLSGNADKGEWNVYFVKKSGDRNCVLTADSACLCALEYERGKLQLRPYFRQNDLYNEMEIHKFLLKHGYYSFAYENERMLEKYIKILEMGEEVEMKRGSYNCGHLIYNKVCNR